MSRQQQDQLDAILRHGQLDTGGDVAMVRAAFNEVMAQVPVPADVHHKPTKIGGVDAVEVTVHGRDADNVILYFHGGVYVIGSAATSVPLVADASALQVSPDELKAAILLFYSLLDEQQRRLFAGLESMKLGHGGDSILAEFLGVDPHTIARGRQQLLDDNVSTGRTRRSGGGRKRIEKKPPTSSH